MLCQFDLSIICYKTIPHMNYIHNACISQSYTGRNSWWYLISLCILHCFSKVFIPVSTVTVFPVIVSLETNFFFTEYNFIKLQNENKEFWVPYVYQQLWKKKLGKQEAWSMSLLCHWPSKPAYYIVDCWILQGPRFASKQK